MASSGRATLMPSSSSGIGMRRDRSPVPTGFAEPSRSRRCIRDGADCDFALELEEPPQDAPGLFLAAYHHPLLPDHHVYLDDLDGSTSPVSLTELLGQPESGWPESQPPAPQVFDSRHSNARTERLAFAHAGFGRNFRRQSLVDPSTSPESISDLGVYTQTRSNSLPALMPGSSYLEPQLLLHSLSESALQSATSYWMPTSQGDGVNGSGGLYDSVSSGISVNPGIGNVIPRSTSPSLAATTAAISAFSQVRAQMDRYGNSNSNVHHVPQFHVKMNHPGEERATPDSLSASALISRVVAPCGMNVSGVPAAAGELLSKGDANSATSSVGMSFSRITSAALCASNSGHQNSDGGLKLVQQLVSCAEAVACRDSRQAATLLRTLRHITSPHGDSMQRVAACFVEGLSIRIYTSPTGFKTSTTSPLVPITSSCRTKPGPSEQERQEALSLLCQSCPYVGFGHYAANTAIMEAFAGEDRLHIIDLGMSQSLQWPSLFYSLASRAEGKPKSLRITAVGPGAGNLAKTRDELQRAALESGITMSFSCVPESLENLCNFKLDLRAGEALAVNSLLQLHCVVKESRGSLNSVLQSIRKLNPKVLTLVEQDASHNGPFFMGRFVEALHYYSAIFDSLEAILPRYSTQRVKIEQFHFAEEIRNIVSCEGPARVERHERIDQWRRRMSRAGFQPLPLKFVNDARQWLANYNCAGYTLAEEKGCLILGWNTKPIIAASCWRR